MTKDELRDAVFSGDKDWSDWESKFDDVIGKEAAAFLKMENSYLYWDMFLDYLLNELEKKNLVGNKEIENLLIRIGEIKNDQIVFWIAEDYYISGEYDPAKRIEFGAFLDREDAELFFDDWIAKGVEDDTGVVMGWSRMSVDEDRKWAFAYDMDFIKEYRQGEIMDLGGEATMNKIEIYKEGI